MSHNKLWIRSWNSSSGIPSIFFRNFIHNINKEKYILCAVERIASTRNRRHQEIVALAAYCTKGRVKHKVNYSAGKYHRFVKGNAKRFIMFLLGAKEIGKWLVNSLGT